MAAQDRLKLQEANLQKTKVTVDRVRFDKDAWKTRCSRIEHKLRHARRKYRDFRSENETKSMTIADLSSERDRLTTQVHALEEERDRVVRDRGNLLNQLSSLVSGRPLSPKRLSPARSGPFTEQGPLRSTPAAPASSRRRNGVHRDQLLLLSHHPRRCGRHDLLVQPQHQQPGSPRIYNRPRLKNHQTKDPSCRDPVPVVDQPD